MKNLFIFFIALIATSHASFKIVDNGSPSATITISSTASSSEVLAADELALAVKIASHAVLPVSKDSLIKSPQIVLSTLDRTDWLKSMGLQTKDLQADRDAIGDSDGFAIRQVGLRLYVLGNQSKGVLNGVYSIIEDATGGVWSRPSDPHPFAVQPKVTLAINRLNFVDTPRFKYRGWHVCEIYRNYHEPTDMWMARNRLNKRKASHIDLDEILPKMNTKGITSAYLPVHNVTYYYIPARKYFEKHPEWFAQLNGIRRGEPYHSTQLCFTNKEMQAEFLKNLLTDVEKEKNRFKTFGVMLEDNNNWCECDLCIKPIELPNGQILTRKDPAFQSTQFFQFLNYLAKELSKKYPGKELETYGYFQTVEAPKISLEPNIRVRLAPFVRSDRHLLDSPTNQKWADAFKAWSKKGIPLSIYEYYSCANAFPRPLEVVVQKDLKWLSKNGVEDILSEIYADTPDVVSGRVLNEAFIANHMQYYIINQLMWNPDLDIESTRAKYLHAVYGPAAEPMKKYYHLLADKWLSDSAPQYYNSWGTDSARLLVVETGIEDECRLLLQNATELSKSSPNELWRIQQDSALFEKYVGLAKKNARPILNIPLTKDNLSKNTDFSSDGWKQAVVINDFRVMSESSKKSKIQTKVYVARSKNDLFVGVDLSDKNMTEATGAPGSDLETFPRGEIFELFLDGDLADKGSYYHFAINIAGARYDGKGFDKTWNGKWSQVITKHADGWKLVLTVPLSEIGWAPGKKLSGLFFRGYRPGISGQSENSSWNGAAVHDLRAFGELRFID